MWVKILVLFLSIVILCRVSYAEDGLILVRISLDEATRQILKEGNKRVLGATTEIIDGREVHIIKVLTPDGHIRYFKIDAETGASIG